jgi:hypothetical protein
MGAFTAQYTKKLARSKGRPLVTQEIRKPVLAGTLTICRPVAITRWGHYGRHEAQARPARHHDRRRRHARQCPPTLMHPHMLGQAFVTTLERRPHRS